MKLLISSLVFITFNCALASFFMRDIPWKRQAQVLNVCFGDPSTGHLVADSSNSSTEALPIDYQELINQTISAEFSELTTGISFKFLGQCSDLHERQIDAIINWRLDPVFQGEGIGGFTYFSKDYRYKSGITFTKYGEKLGTGKLTPKEKFIMSVVHEFGHLAGLGHEHLMLEALTDKNCDLLPEIFKRPGVLYGRNNIGRTQDVVSKYDPYSIMNYCWNTYIDENGLSGQIHLSTDDKNALKARYPLKGVF